MAVLALSALGLNILIGFTGQISLGHAAFMGVGAYATAILASRFGLPFWLSIPAGGALATGAGMVVGAPSLRIKGLYLAIATLSAQVIFEWVFTNWTSVTGGIRGLNVAPASDRRLPARHRRADLLPHPRGDGGPLPARHRTCAARAGVGPSWRCATGTWPPRSWA